MCANDYDVAIVGGGVVGLATALQISRRFPSARCVVLEKEGRLGKHQTGHNNGVIHTGIYYKPGSLKAKNCVRGAAMMKEFCDDNGIEYENCGKVVVAVNDSELPALYELYNRGVTNGVEGLELIGPEKLQQIEPHARGVKAINSPKTSIVDYQQVTEVYAKLFRELGGEVWTGHRLLTVKNTKGMLGLDTTSGSITSKYLINCAGLHADKVAEIAGVVSNIRLIPFRGEYYSLKPHAISLVNNLIYPVPDPRFPFLGATFGRTRSGTVRTGPNAMVAGSREGYSIVDIDLNEMWSILTYPAFWKMVSRYWRTGIQEMVYSVMKTAFVKSMQKMVPELREEDLERWGSGVRAQAIRSDGTLIDDFVIKESCNAIHVINAPSPGATSSLSIGLHITNRAEEIFDLN